MNREPSPAGPSTSTTPSLSIKSGRELSREERSGFSYSEAYPSSTYLPAIPWSVHNKIMRQAAAGLCFISSFDSSTQTALEMVTHLMSSYMTSICQQAKTNCEVAGRTIPIPTDVWLGLVNLGHDVEALPVYMNQICTGGNLVIPPPKVQNSPQHALPLKVGKTRSHPAHINEFLPPFPDPHTYIRTDIFGEPDTSYEKVRELAAQRKRDTELSLVDFMLRVHPRTCLYRDYEARVKEDAQLAIHERERQKEAMKAAERQAKAVEQLRQDVKMEVTSEIPENFMEDEDTPKRTFEKPVSDEDVDLDLEETETSLILRKIPAWCNVLDPSLETRPYLSALVSEELQEDETSESTKASRQQSKTGEEVYDNAYLRPPRMPAKGSYVQF